jgi:heme exporter protein CcmD
MGGYAWFVWPAFVITIIVLAGLALASGRTLKRRETALTALGDRRRPAVAGTADVDA